MNNMYDINLCQLKLSNSYDDINDYNETVSFINYCKDNLPNILNDSNIEIQKNNKWNLSGEIISPRYGKTTNNAGKNIFLLDNYVIVERDSPFSTLIYYKRGENISSHHIIRNKDINFFVKKIRRYLIKYKQ